jgi:hypothetical protein
MRKAPCNGPIFLFPCLRVEFFVRIDSFRAQLMRNKLACRATYCDNICFRRYNAQPNCHLWPRMGIVQCCNCADRKSILSRVEVEKTIGAQETQIVLRALLLLSSSNQVHDRSVNTKLCNCFSSLTKLKVLKMDKSGKEHLPSKNHEIIELDKSLFVCGVD